MLTSSDALPGVLLDAHFLEERIGDGELGPSDFVSFAALSVAPADVARWRASLPPLDSLQDRPRFVTPKQPRAWWLRAADFPSLEFFSPATVTRRATGWVGVHGASNTIYIFTFTQ